MEYKRKGGIIKKINLISLTLGLVLGLALTVLVLNMNTSQLSFEKGIQEITEIHSLIHDSYSYESFVQIFKENQSNVVVVPDSLSGRQDNSLEGLYARSRHFIFKDIEGDTVFYVSLSASRQNLKEPLWTHSIGYSPSNFNQADGRYEESYMKNSPSSEAYTYAWKNKSYEISITAVSNNINQESAYTLSQLALFTEDLFNFLKENGY